MKKYSFLFSLIFSVTLINSSFAVDATAPKDETTRSNAVIFKVHDIKPVSEDGIVTGCDYTLTLYNRTAINFRTFNINLTWEDEVNDAFKFDKYAESVLGAEAYKQQKAFFIKDDNLSTLKTSLNVSAFGVGKQLSINAHLDTDKCYLLLRDATYSVTPCDIVRSVDNKDFGIETKENDCTPLFQFVSVDNPEYYGKFQDTSASTIAANNKLAEGHELSEIDNIIEKIVDNIGSSEKALTGIK